jgi:S-adenosylmethionine:tRNA ribosyltransferase-isomerase
LGGQRDGVRLQVACASSGIIDSTFDRLPEYLRRGDLLVVNDSATLPAAIDGRLENDAVRVHISTRVPGVAGRLVEIREPLGPSSRPMQITEPTRVVLEGGGAVELVAPHDEAGVVSRLWRAELHLPEPLVPYLHHHGQPVRYQYVGAPWPLKFYQTEFAMRPGSSEMPSAARPFTRRLIERLLGNGVHMEFITLHAGLSSGEAHEPPCAEEFRVSAQTAEAVNRCRSEGRRVIAVGTTVVRALESARRDGGLEPCAGFTELVVTPDSPVASIDGLVTGWHEPKASHLMMLEAFVGSEFLACSYEAALRAEYLWHEFGDSQLLLRETSTSV